MHPSNPTQYISISFLVQTIIMFYNNWQFSSRDTQHQLNTAFASHASSISHSLLNHMPLSYAAFPRSNAISD